MDKIVTLENTCRVETFSLSEEQHDIVVNKMVKKGVHHYGSYTLEEVDSYTLDAWIDVAKEEGNKEYENFLTEAKSANAEVYTLNDNLGDFSQPIGDVAVWDC